MKQLPPAAPPKWGKTALRATALVGVSLLSGFVLRPAPATDTAAAIDAAPPPAIVQPGPATLEAVIPMAEPPAVKEATPVVQTPAPQPEPEPNPELDPEPEPQALHYLEAVGLDPETQEATWTVCKENPTLFSMVTAMGFFESNWTTDAVGDHGNSLGWMQVQPRWHQERMDRLGVTDLLDPVQNVRVAVDYIDWIAERLNPGNPADAYGTHALLMAYNQGWQGASESWSAGRYSTNYSRKVLDLAATYLEEVEGWT